MLMSVHSVACFPILLCGPTSFKAISDFVSSDPLALAMTKQRFLRLAILLSLGVWILMYFLSAARSIFAESPAATLEKKAQEQLPGTPLNESRKYFSSILNIGNAQQADSDTPITRSPRPAPDSKVRVLILAGERTGSSFVGSLLSSSSDIFYVFEPGLSIGAALGRNHVIEGSQIAGHLYLGFLRNLFRCDFKKLDFYLQWLSKKSSGTLRKWVPRVHDLCFQNSTEKTCNVTHDIATDSCRRSQFLAVKSIRVPDINLFLPLIEDKTINLKVIHLVRDPRPTQASRVFRRRRANFVSESMREMLYLYCKYSWQNLELGTRSPILKDRYMLLRYEDAALDPVAAATRIYKFLGRSQVPESVRRWIDANTKSFKPGVLSTTKNSTEAYRAWRHRLPFDAAKAIEETGHCKEMMERTGYRLLEDEQHLKNMSRSLVDSIPPVSNGSRYGWLWTLTI